MSRYGQTQLEEGLRRRDLVKLEILKAYDLLNWTFIESILMALGFHAQFINWIMQFISSTMYSILVNDFPFSFFKGKSAVK